MAYKYKRVGAIWYSEEKKQFSIKINEDISKDSKLYIFANDKPKGEKSPQYNLCIKDPAYIEATKQTVEQPKEAVQDSMGF